MCVFLMFFPKPLQHIHAELLSEATDAAAGPNHHRHVGLARHAPVEGDATLLSAALLIVLWVMCIYREIATCVLINVNYMYVNVLCILCMLCMLCMLYMWCILCIVYI